MYCTLYYFKANCELRKNICTRPSVRAHSDVCNVCVKQKLKRACDVRTCEDFRGLTSCDSYFARFVL